MPANRADMLAKAPSYGADALVFDLEDSVPIAEKTKARALAREFIEQHKTKSAVYARVNALETGMVQDDLEAIAVDGLLGIRLPKAESAEAIRVVDAILTALEHKRALKPGSIAISPSLESAKGVWFAYDILSASPRVRSVTAGTAQDGDLQTDLGYTWTAEGEEVLYVRSRILLAARAAGSSTCSTAPTRTSATRKGCASAARRRASSVIAARRRCIRTRSRPSIAPSRPAPRSSTITGAS